MASEQRITQNARTEMYNIRSQVLSERLDALSKKELIELRSHLLETYSKTGRTDAHPGIFAECDNRITGKLAELKATNRFIFSAIVSSTILVIAVINLYNDLQAPPQQAPVEVGSVEAP